MIEVNEDNYFDVAEALHACLIAWHGGQWSETYRLLCRSKFKPGMAWSESLVEQENEYYAEIEELCRENKIEELEKLFNGIDAILNDESRIT